jgi:hypothetical protein
MRFRAKAAAVSPDNLASLLTLAYSVLVKRMDILLVLFSFSSGLLFSRPAILASPISDCMGGFVGY